MKTYRIPLMLALATAAMLFGAVTTQAQEGPGRGRGNFDPEEFRARMMERMREQFEVTDDAEWKVISERLGKVMEARRDAGGFGGRFGAFRGRGPGGDDDDAGDRRRGGRRGGFEERSPEVEALREALESGASASDIKAKLAKVREVREANRKELEKAQKELREVLSVRQEATAVLMGMLP